MLLGTFWERRELADDYLPADRIALVGDPFLRGIARIGTPAAKLALLALARLDRGELAPRARQLAEGLSGRVPLRVQKVGTARLVEALVTALPGDGELVIFRSDGAGPCGHMLAVYIDERHRRIAKHVALLRSDALTELSEGSREFSPADLDTACRKVGRAIKRTDVVANPPVNESFSQYRAIALARLSPLAG